MPFISLENAQAQLPELIEHLAPGEEWLITQQDRPVARLISADVNAAAPRKPGIARGKLNVLADDDDHLEDFKDFMP
jgi:antitoxin (DNA-binding transcriptional repressor) of toxin-antitoxin stability system